MADRQVPTELRDVGVNEGQVFQQRPSFLKRSPRLVRSSRLLQDIAQADQAEADLVPRLSIDIRPFGQPPTDSQGMPVARDRLIRGAEMAR